MLWSVAKPAPPQGLHIEVNKVCNYRCKTCMIWAKKEDLNRVLPIGRRVEIVEEFAEMNPRGRVFVCGGETLLHPERIFALTRRANELGLSSQMATNGSLVDEQMADRLITEGPSQIAVSLNSQDPDIHDHTRGRRGSFEEVVHAISRLRGARERHASNTRIHVNAIISELNYRNLESFHEFVLYELQADKLDLGFLQPTFELHANASKDRFFANTVVGDAEHLGKILRRCSDRFHLSFNPEWIDQVVMYHRSIRQNGDATEGWAGRGTEEHICGTYDKNIMVDPQGIARLCFSTSFRGVSLKRKGDLARFWQGAHDIRRKMKRCHAYCGLVDVCIRVNLTREEKEPRALLRES